MTCKNPLTEREQAIQVIFIVLLALMVWGLCLGATGLTFGWLITIASASISVITSLYLIFMVP